jgi:hypothetical protein
MIGFVLTPYTVATQAESIFFLVIFTSGITSKKIKNKKIKKLI